METILTQYYQSPYGELLLGSFGDKLCLCDWMLNEKRRVTVDKRIRQVLHADYEEGTSEVIARAIIQLDEYFACKRTIFDVPLLAVGTEFQRTVWQELQNIPYGKTVSYGELSRKLGNPKAVRAVAAANGANALSILIPCHRVVGSNHTLIGYAGGLAAKQGMLALTFVDKADYDKIQEHDLISVIGLTDFAPGRNLKIVLHHEDGTKDSFEAQHTYNEQQIGWFRAGSALNAR